MNPRISIIAAIGENRELGKNNDLIFHISEDMKHFRDLTHGHPVIMGRKTWDSLPHKPLPNRVNIVITRDLNYKANGAIVCDSIEKAVEISTRIKNKELRIKEENHNSSFMLHNSDKDEVFIIGGGQIYKEALPFVHRLYLTIVDATVDADVFFPDYSEFEKVISEEIHESDGYKYKFVTLEK